MKKLFVLLLMAVAFCGSAEAQLWDYSKPDKRVAFGVRVGLNMTYSHEVGVHFENGMSFHGGIVADYNIVKSLAIETGLSYSVKSVKCLIWNGLKENADLSSLQLPLFAKYRYYLSDNLQLQVKAGGYIGYKVDAPKVIRTKREEYLATRKIDNGVAVGLGLSLSRWYIGAQYEWGLRSVEKISLRTLNLSFGYDF